MGACTKNGNNKVWLEREAKANSQKVLNTVLRGNLDDEREPLKVV